MGHPVQSHLNAFSVIGIGQGPKIYLVGLCSLKKIVGILLLLLLPRKVSHPLRRDKKGEEICMDKRILNEEEGWKEKRKKKSLVRQQISAVWVAKC